MSKPPALLSLPAVPPQVLLIDFLVRLIEMMKRAWFNFLAMLGAVR